MSLQTLATVQALFAEVVGVDAPAPDTDVVETGLIDSMAIVELLFALEQELGIEIPPALLDIEHFRTLERLAALVDACDAA